MLELLPFDPALLPVYLSALVAVYLAPGPDMALVLAVSGASGARAGLMTSLGIAAARFAHVMASGLGLAALLAAHPPLIVGVRAIGALYLLFLAWKLWRAQPASPESADRPSAPRPHSHLAALAAMRRGLFTNLLNPKALLFCGLFLPQFASPAHGPLLPQFAALGLILVLVGLAFDTCYTLLASGLAARLSNLAAAPRLGRLRNRFMGSVFAALAARLVAG